MLPTFLPLPLPLLPRLGLPLPAALPTAARRPRWVAGAAGGWPAWERAGRAAVLLPRGGEAAAAVHFVGGALAGSFPRESYGAFLEAVSAGAGVAVVATPCDLDADHWALAGDVAAQWEAAAAAWGGRPLPVIGVAHSLGGKLLTLAEARPDLRARLGPRAANVIISFCNASAGAAAETQRWAEGLLRDLVPGGGLEREQLEWAARGWRGLRAGVREMAESFAPGADGPWRRGEEALDKVEGLLGGMANVLRQVRARGEFAPGPAELEHLLEQAYGVPRNLAVRFSRDRLDQTDSFVARVRARFGDKSVLVRELPGSHVTPLTPRMDPPDPPRPDDPAAFFEEPVRRTASAAQAELDRLVAVVVAFLTLQIELNGSRGTQLQQSSPP